MECAEALIGRPETLAELCGYQAKSPYTWRRASMHRAAGDLPSARVQRILLTHAREQGIPLRAEHLVFGAGADEIERLRAGEGRLERAA